ncbi:MAG: HNH endonuclease [Alphaproteobacteria bacterium]|nr:HNH endonuclease [Alphaproteobacteria bacterium]
MFQKVKKNNGDLYFQYDLKGCPSRFVEIKRLPAAVVESQWGAWRDDEETRKNFMREWAKGVVLEGHFGQEEIRQLREEGIVPKGYNIHHIVPRALGGELWDKKNVVLMPVGLHRRMHHFMREYELIKWMITTRPRQEIPEGHKVFLSVPLLPPIVSGIHVPYVFIRPQQVNETKRRDVLIAKFLALYPQFARQEYPFPILTMNRQHTTNVAVRYQPKRRKGKWPEKEKRR